MIKERPILFSAPMVRAILEGRKTQTRRIVKLRGNDGLQSDHSAWRFCEFHGNKAVWQHRTDISRVITEKCPHGVSGDRLWVKESWKIGAWRNDGRMAIDYLATPEIKHTPWVIATDNSFEERYWEQSTNDLIKAGMKPDWEGIYHWEPGEAPTRKRPSMFMPRWASRILVENRQIRVERLQDITEEDAMAEGASPWQYGPEQCLTSGERGALSPYRGGFACLWDEINADRATWKSNPWVWGIEFKRI